MVFITKFARIGLQAARQLSATPLVAVQGRAFHLTSLLAKGNPLFMQYPPHLKL